MLLILIYLCLLPGTPIHDPTKMATEAPTATKYPLELFEYIRDRITDCTEDCRKFVDEELRAERKHLRDSIPIILAGVNTIIENSQLAKNLSDHMLQTETLSRYLEERVSSLERIVCQLSINQSSSHVSPSTSPAH